MAPIYDRDEVLADMGRPGSVRQYQEPSLTRDLLLAIPRGIANTAAGVYGLADTLAMDALPDISMSPLGTADTGIGSFATGTVQFLSGFIPIAGGLSKLGKAGRALAVTRSQSRRFAAAGIATDFAVFDGNEERLSNLIQSFPTLANPISDFLAADEDDPELVGRLKNALEGIGFDMMLGGLAHVLSRQKRAQRALERNDRRALNQAYEELDKGEIYRGLSFFQAPPRDRYEALAYQDGKQPRLRDRDAITYGDNEFDRQRERTYEAVVERVTQIVNTGEDADLGGTAWHEIVKGHARRIHQRIVAQGAVLEDPVEEIATDDRVVGYVQRFMERTNTRVMHPLLSGQPVEIGSVIRDTLEDYFYSVGASTEGKRRSFLAAVNAVQADEDLIARAKEGLLSPAERMVMYPGEMLERMARSDNSVELGGELYALLMARSNGGTLFNLSFSEDAMRLEIEGLAREARLIVDDIWDMATFGSASRDDVRPINAAPAGILSAREEFYSTGFATVDPSVTSTFGDSILLAGREPFDVDSLPEFRALPDEGKVGEYKRYVRELVAAGLFTAPQVRALSLAVEGYDFRFLPDELDVQAVPGRRIGAEDAPAPDSGVPDGAEQRELFMRGEGGAAGAGFRDWFGDSKLVDESGEPLVFTTGKSLDVAEYEAGVGSERLTRAMDRGRSGQALDASDEQALDRVTGPSSFNARDAAGFGVPEGPVAFGGENPPFRRPQQVYVKASNPFRVGKMSPEQELEFAVALLERSGADEGAQRAAAIRAAVAAGDVKESGLSNRDFLQMVEGDEVARSRVMRSVLKKLGYDAFVGKSKFADEGDIVVTLAEDQIKAVDAFSFTPGAPSVYRDPGNLGSVHFEGGVPKKLRIAQELHNTGDAQAAHVFLHELGHMALPPGSPLLAAVRDMMASLNGQPVDAEGFAVRSAMPGGPAPFPLTVHRKAGREAEVYEVNLEAFDEALKGSAKDYVQPGGGGKGKAKYDAFGEWVEGREVSVGARGQQLKKPKAGRRTASEGIAEQPVETPLVKIERREDGGPLVSISDGRQRYAWTRDTYGRGFVTLEPEDVEVARSLGLLVPGDRAARQGPLQSSVFRPTEPRPGDQFYRTTGIRRFIETEFGIPQNSPTARRLAEDPAEFAAHAFAYVTIKRGKQSAANRGLYEIVRSMWARSMDVISGAFGKRDAALETDVVGELTRIVELAAGFDPDLARTFRARLAEAYDQALSAGARSVVGQGEGQEAAQDAQGALQGGTGADELARLADGARAPRKRQEGPQQRTLDEAAPAGDQAVDYGDVELGSTEPPPPPPAPPPPPPPHPGWVPPRRRRPSRPPPTRSGTPRAETAPGSTPSSPTRPAAPRPPAPPRSKAAGCSRRDSAPRPT